MDSLGESVDFTEIHAMLPQSLNFGHKISVYTGLLFMNCLVN